jgi:ABC-type branched-subunit amino acid transport system ATPase component
MIASATGLAAGYGTTTVLHDVTLELAEGQVTCLLGRNGAGKTTLAKSMLGLLTPTRGEVTVGGQRVTSRRSHEIMRLGVGYAPQEAGVFRELTVMENLVISARGRRIDRRLIADAITPFPVLEERLQQRAGTLSGGEQKMLILARALLGAPPLVVLDEISEGVQPNLLDAFAERIAATVAAHGSTVLVIEQHLAFALSMSAHFAVMESGAIVDRDAVDGTTRARVEKHLLLQSEPDPNQQEATP